MNENNNDIDKSNYERVHHWYEALTHTSWSIYSFSMKTHFFFNSFLALSYLCLKLKEHIKSTQRVWQSQPGAPCPEKGLQAQEKQQEERGQRREEIHYSE